MIETQLLFDQIQKAFDREKPFVAFRKPNEKSVKAIFQKNDALHTTPNFEKEGFVFSPFETTNQNILLLADEKLEATTNSHFLKEFKIASGTIFLEENGADKKHIELVEKTICHIKRSTVSKIVIARSKKIQIQIDFLTVFKKLLTLYESAYVYVWFHPKVGMWLGATPETLVKVKENSFETMSLAGTQKFEGSIDVNWGEKELEEQQMVTDSILSNLEAATKTIEYSKVETIQAGNLMHLQTKISGELNSLNLKELIYSLHPTPAVCGYPRKEAKEFILKNENFNRSYYTGFLGELNMEGTTNLFVNLRCMEVVNSEQVRLYVGGGITEKSIAENEWEETVAKSKTIGSVL